jgi:hypothetical protein
MNITFSNHYPSVKCVTNGFLHSRDRLKNQYASYSHDSGQWNLWQWGDDDFWQFIALNSNNSLRDNTLTLSKLNSLCKKACEHA